MEASSGSRGSAKSGNGTSTEAKAVRERRKIASTGNQGNLALSLRDAGSQMMLSGVADIYALGFCSPA